MPQQIYNLSLSAWLTPTIIDEIYAISDYVENFYYGLGGLGDSAVTELLRLRGGSLLRDIIDRMKHKISCITMADDKSCTSINPLKYYAYSAVNCLNLNFGGKFINLLLCWEIVK